jgi:putative membrane protein
MNETTHNWIRVVHIFGFLLWTGGLISTLNLLIAQQSVDGDARAVLSKITRKTALIMDIGALLALIGGFYLAFGASGDSAFKQGGWLHAKSTLVVGLIAIQVFTRIKVRKFRNGNIKPIPGFVIPLTPVLIAVIVILGTVKPM